MYSLYLLARAYLDSSDLARVRGNLDRMRPADRQNDAMRLIGAILLALEGQREAALKEIDEEVLT